KAGDPVKMAEGFASAMKAGRLAFEAGLIEPRDMASPSTPLAGTPFFKIDHASCRAVARLDPFYPIFPDPAWLGRLLPQGIKLVQLRIKDQPSKIVRAEIVKAIELCAAHDCQLVINDYWLEAMEAGADFVHLGQEDLAGADLAALKAARI